MAEIGLTQARSIGPIAAEVEQAGGSIARVFQRAELPLRLIEQPDRLLLLRDQLRLLECAAREIGDEALPARLSVTSGVAGLGAFGRHVNAATRLGEGITRANTLMGSQLQSATSINLRVTRGWARWTYTVTDAAAVGRQKNELLALGYMLDMVRGFAGRAWVPTRAELPGPRLAARPAENVFGCTLAPGEIAGLIFPAELLEMTRPGSPRPEDDASADVVPDAADFIACVEHLIALVLLDGRPRLDRLCERLGTSRRSLQRRLARDGVRFDDMVDRVLLREAMALMRDPRFPLTAIALELGYSDPAHFTRAFARWTGQTPSAWRRASGAASAHPPRATAG